MKLYKYISIFLIGFLVLCLSGCEDWLEPEVYSETAPDNLFESLKGVESVLFAAYANVAENRGNDLAQNITASESMTDVGFGELGAIANWLTNFQDFVLDGSGSARYGDYWNLPYRAIRNANILLENIDGANISDESKKLIVAECHFIRGISYYKLLIRFGPTPLRISTDQELEIPRATEEEMNTFIEEELLAAIPDLPAPGQESKWGRATSGAAMGVLTKFYLNTKQWQKCADQAEALMDLNYYELFPSYFELFMVKSEQNKEMIWVSPCKGDLGRAASLSYMNFAWPQSFALHPETGLTFCDGCRNFATMFKLRNDFWSTFHPDDLRKSLIITEYVNTDGDTIHTVPPDDNPRPFKYWPDDDWDGPGYGNDVPFVRYADILLSRAEALNEINNGPTVEAIDLINMVRDRAGVPYVFETDFASKEELNEHILAERGWELWWEGRRREDLIRHGEFISRAQDRGLPAQSHHVRHPIPIKMMEANPLLEQNPGYNL